MEQIYVALFVAYFSINSFVAGTFIERGLTDGNSYNKVKFSLSCAFIVLFAIPAFSCIYAFYFTRAAWLYAAWERGLLLGAWYDLFFTDKLNNANTQQLRFMRKIADKSILKRYTHFIVDLIEAKSKKYASNIANTATNE